MSTEINTTSAVDDALAGLTPEEREQIAGMTPSEDNDGCQVGKCCDCEEICNDLLPTESGDLRCGECDSNYGGCSICGEEQSRDDHCRHIFLAADYEWNGSGAYMDPCLRKPLFRLFDLMPSGFPVDLRCAIKSGEFYTFLTAPMIGNGGMLALYGMPEREMPRENCCYILHWWGAVPTRHRARRPR